MTNYAPPPICASCGQPTGSAADRLLSMLRIALWDADMTQEALAEKIGFTPKHISQVFNDKVRLSFEMAERISAAVGVRLVVGIEPLPALVHEKDRADG